GGPLRALDDEGDGQRNLGAGLGVELLDLYHVSDGDLVLLAACLDDCVRGVLGCHRSSSFRLWARATCRSARDALVRSRVGPAVVGFSRKTTGPGYVRLAYRVKSSQVTACARCAWRRTTAHPRAHLPDSSSRTPVG